MSIYIPKPSSDGSMKSKHTHPIRVCASVITVSTTRTIETDTSGHLICDLLERAGITVGYYGIVPDEIERIREILRTLPGQTNCIIFCGGTGLTKDDYTIEAVKPFLQKKIDGFGELFRWMSYQEIGTSAILSRALAGIINTSAVFCIPGSPEAARLAVSALIIPEIMHILSHAQK
jgi:molybdenum cofactor biosynthesis protein B